MTVGVRHETLESAVQSLRTWWRETGAAGYSLASSLAITADRGAATAVAFDSGGSSGRLSVAPRAPDHGGQPTARNEHVEQEARSDPSRLSRTTAREAPI
jgi:hypothetical protein